MVAAGRRYQVRELLGEGAFGSVYLAQAMGAGLQRDVAIKVLRRERAEDAVLLGRLRDEARMLAMIRHRAIVRVDDLVELDGNWSIIMEYVEGCDVAALIARGPLPPRVALTIAEEVANALQAAWQQLGPDGQPLRLVHRDIKPANIRLTPQGEVKLLDFGVARAEFAGRESGTTQSSFGTIVYMAAERFEGRDTHASDVYALGVTLFEMLTGVPPGRVAADRDRQPPGHRHAEQWAAIAGISPDLHDLVARMLAFDDADRPTARECGRALEELRGRLRGDRVEDWAARIVPGVVAEQRSGPRSDARTGSVLVERPAGPAASAATGSSRALPWVAGGALSMLLLGGVGIVSAGALWWFLRAPAPAPRLPGSPMADTLKQAADLAPAATPAPVAPASPPPDAPPSPPTQPGTNGSGTPRSRTSPAPPLPTGAPDPVKNQPLPEKGPVAPKPAAGEGRLELTSDDPGVAARFTGPTGRVSAGVVAAGTYTAVVTFPSGSTVNIAGAGTVLPGKTARLTCRVQFTNCAWSAE